MPYETSSPTSVPNYRLHRLLADAPDSAKDTVKTHGMNMNGFKYGVLQVVPSAAADPSIEILFWSDEKAAFISQNPTLTATSPGAGEPWEFKFDALGRIVWIFVGSGLAGGDTVELLIAGAND